MVDGWYGCFVIFFVLFLQQGITKTRVNETGHQGWSTSRPKTPMLGIEAVKMARPVPLKDHTTHVFMLYRLYYHEFRVGRLKWTIGYTMMLMMDVGSISSMMSSWVVWWVFYPHLPKEKGGILNSKRNLPPKRNTTTISPISTWKCPFLDASNQKNHTTRNHRKKTGNWICSGTLDMPPYSDFETCRHKMTQMLRLGRAHFDEGAGQLSIVGAIWREGLSI